jgi:zinc/manganese transport system substrate-binding protein
LGVTIKTPTEFSEAIEEERDASVADLEAVASLLRTRQVNMLVINSSTKTAQIDYLIAAAESAEIPVFEFSELPPQGELYSNWIDFYLAELDSNF